MSHVESKIRLLCVDDSEQLTSAWVRLVGNQHDMEMAGTLASADQLIEAVQSKQPSVVLMDVSMNGKDPLDALAELRQVCPEVHTIIYSGRSEPELIARAMQAGARAFVDKGRSPVKILDTIRRVSRGEPVTERP